MLQTWTDNINRIVAKQETIFVVATCTQKLPLKQDTNQLLHTMRRIMSDEPHCLSGVMNHTAERVGNEKV